MEGSKEVLRAEHEDIRRIASVLETMAGRMRGMANIPRGDLDRAMAVLEEYADQCHHSKEEEVLFPELSRASPRAGADLVRRLAADHQALRKLLGTMGDLVPRAAVDGAARAELARLMEVYVRLLREHMRIEEERLFPEAGRTLGPEVEARMAVEFERIEGSRVGARMHGVYRRMIEDLTEAYGGGSRFPAEGVRW